jgi:hypothetical protein
VVYDDSPSRLDDPVDLDELVELIASDAKPFGRDARRFVHFLSRVEVSFRQHRQQIQLLHRDVQQANLRSASLGRPTTLDPATSAQYLPFEEVAKQFDQHMSQRLAIQERIELDVLAARAEAVRRVNAVKFVIEGILDDPDVDASTKERIVAALSSLPDEPVGEPAAFATVPSASMTAPVRVESDVAVSPGAAVDDLDELFS